MLRRISGLTVIFRSHNNVRHLTVAPDAPFDEFTKEFTQQHIQLTRIQRILLGAGSSVAALLDPRRHDMIAALGETTGVDALRTQHDLMLATTEGTEILTAKPRINTKTIDLNALQKLPESTFGFAYWKFLDDNKVTPDSRMEVRFVDDPELAYVMTRYRECHDLVHTVLGMPTHMLGEVAVKWVEALNTGLPMCYGAALFGSMRLRPKQRKLYRKDYLPWAIKMGRQAKPLLGVYWEQRWEQDLVELQRELNIDGLVISEDVK